MDSILNTIKKNIGIDSDYTAYDAVLITHINTVITSLNAIGIGLTEHFAITGSTETWTDFVGNPTNLEFIKTYFANQVKNVFNPLNLIVVENPNSILGSVKKMLGILYIDNSFDTDIIININTIFMKLNQLGIGPTVGFSILSNAEVWTDFLGQAIDIAAVKSYVYLGVRLLFDPPTNTTFLEALTRQNLELEWRLAAQVDKLVVEGVEDVIDD